LRKETELACTGGEKFINKGAVRVALGPASQSAESRCLAEHPDSVARLVSREPQWLP